MARNAPPDMRCMECEEPASTLCLECVYEEDGDGALCAAHTKVHPHDDYGPPLPLVNSPRMGVCGYAGPTDPPY